MGNQVTQAAAGRLPRLDLGMVERQVQHNGAYSPLEWLLESGLLSYPDYEHWRHGGVRCLEDVIHADVNDWPERLREGEVHARSLGLVCEVQSYFDWRPGPGERSLTLSANAERARLLERRWVRPADLRQLDLFLDDGVNGVEHDLRAALAARATTDAQRHYERLSRMASSHPGLGDFERLLLYALHLERRPAIPADAVVAELEWLVREIAPLARERIRGQARDYLAPAWRRLGEALPRDRFEPGQPDFHSSYPQMQIPDWEAVQRSVQSVPDHAGHVVLLSRLALALHHRQSPEAAILVWARVCERAPESSPLDLIPELASRPYRYALEFEALDEPLATSDFPGWLLLREPGLLHHLERVNTPVPAGGVCRAAAKLLRARARGADEVAARRELQQLSPALLRVYLEMRSGS